LKVLGQFCKSLQVDGSAWGLSSGFYANIIDHVRFSSGSTLHIARRSTRNMRGHIVVLHQGGHIIEEDAEQEEDGPRCTSNFFSTPLVFSTFEREGQREEEG